MEDFLPRREKTGQSAGPLIAHGLLSGGWPELALALVVLAGGCIGPATNPSSIGEPNRRAAYGLEVPTV